MSHVRAPIARGALAFAGLALACRVSAASLAVVGGTVYTSPETPPLRDATILVTDDRIEAIGVRGSVTVDPRTPTLNAGGRTVVAGFWNSHVHLIPDTLLGAADRPATALSAQMRSLFVAWGFTSVFDLGSPLENTLALRRRIESGEVTGPRVLTVGDPFYPPDGTPIYIRDWVRRNGIPSGEVATPDAARQRARSQFAAGADGAKVFAGAIIGGPQGVRLMQQDVVAAVVGEAHAAGRRAFAHPTTNDGLRVAVDGGVDVLAHCTATMGPWSDAVVGQLVARNVALVPTLQLFAVELAKDGMPPDARAKILAAGQQQVRALLAAGGTVLFGTDVGFLDVADPREEYRLLREAGLDHRQILRSLTTAPAERFGFAGRSGRIAPGYEADLVILDGDPAVSPEAFADVACTVRQGRVVYARSDACAIAP